MTSPLLSSEILPMQSTDTAACAAIEAELFAGDSPWSQASFQQELAFPHNHYYVIKQSQTIIGYAGIAHFPTPDNTGRSEILTLGIAPPYQQQGLGKRLLEFLLTTADELHNEVFLEVRTDNQPAINLYIKLGFEKIALRKNYYPQSKMDAFTMRRKRRL